MQQHRKIYKAFSVREGFFVGDKGASLAESAENAEQIISASSAFSARNPFKEV
jgi:hypothetical protein